MDSSINDANESVLSELEMTREPTSTAWEKNAQAMTGGIKPCPSHGSKKDLFIL